MAQQVERDWSAAAPADMEGLFESVRNWGRWGADDERGALNYITPERVASAARLVESGVAVSCALEFPTRPAPDNPRPAQHMMVVAGDACTETGIPGMESAMDFIGVAFHGMAVSHMDALCHVFVRETMYNGFKAADVKSTGARRNSIMAAKDGISGRGVLLDIPRLKGLLHLLDKLRLDALAGACAEHGRWEFFFTLAPLRVKRGTGSPVNPVALF